MGAIDPKDFYISEIQRTERYLESLKQAFYSYLALSSEGKVGERQGKDVNDPPIVRRAGNRPERHKKTGKWATPPIALTAQVEQIISDFEPGRTFQILDIFAMLKDYDGESAGAVKGRISTILGRLMAKPGKASFERTERGFYIKKES